MFRFQVRFEQKGNRDLISKISRMPKAMERASQRMARVGANNIRTQISAKHHIHTGKLFGSVRTKKLSDKSTVVMMYDYGEELGTMKPHYVAVKPQRKRLTQWVLAKFGKMVKSGKSMVYMKKGMPRGHLYVQPSDYLLKALLKTRSMTRKILREEIARTVK